MGQGARVISRRAVLAAGAGAVLAGCREGGLPTDLPGGFAGASAERGHLLREQREFGPPRTTRRTRVLIAGGGVAGLAAARALRLRGIEDFALLELEDAAGGNSRAGELGGLACPLGAHYLPVPGDSAAAVQDLLEEFGLRQRVAGRWTYDERHLCHSPQERLFFEGHWQEGLLPLEGIGEATLAQYLRFAQRVQQAQGTRGYAISASKVPASRTQIAPAAMTFIAWLDREGLTDPHLRWYLDYGCRDDYGAGLGTVSAWAGLHYFAARHGFHPPGFDEGGEREQILTWPEGNGWLARRLAQPLGDRLVTQRVVVRIEEGRHGVEVDALDPVSGALERWQADHCIVALPAFVAARVVRNAPGPFAARALGIRYAPWVVVNMHVRAPLADRRGAAPAWDNVVYGGSGLGYVDAGHQRLDPRPGPTVLSWYCAPGLAARRDVLTQPWRHWVERAVAELAAAHPDLPDKLTRAEVARYGHAMAVPVPGRVPGAEPPPRWGRLAFAHADWVGYSIFEEAFTLGHDAGQTVG
jgi:monoamine oxidase